MVTILKKGETKENMQQLLEKLAKKNHRKLLDAHKYCGTIRLEEDALTIQKKLRNEWD